LLHFQHMQTLIPGFESCAGYTAPLWACSPAPKQRNLMCPAPADGDKARCNARTCLPDAGCATEECNAVQGRIQANITLVLDAWLQRGVTCQKQEWTVAECCQLCQQTAQCNVWSFCNHPRLAAADRHHLLLGTSAAQFCLVLLLIALLRMTNRQQQENHQLQRQGATAAAPWRAEEAAMASRCKGCRHWIQCGGLWH
jgi:hypothetical protein